MPSSSSPLLALSAALQNVITMLARGVKASKTVLADTLSEPLNGFLDRSISSRIGLRLLIENQVCDMCVTVIPLAQERCGVWESGRGAYVNVMVSDDETRARFVFSFWLIYWLSIGRGWLR
jgi:hypothetical protein